MSYKVGSLDLPIVASATKSVSEVQKTINQLDKLHRTLTNLSGFKMNTTGLDSFTTSMQNLSNALSTGINQDGINKVNTLSRVMGKIQQIGMGGSSLANYSFITTFFNEIAKASSLIDTDNIDKIANLSTALSGLSKFSTQINKIDFDKVAVGFNNLAVSIKPFLEVVNQSAQSLSSLEGVLKRVSSKKLQTLTSDSKNPKGGFSNIFSFAKLSTVIYSTRRLGRFVADVVQAGSDYTESLNMWQVAMRENIDLAEKFVTKMNKAYGISEKTLMTTQATFKNMIGSLGQITENVAYELSEAITQMAVDYSSLYNVQLNTAFQKFQAMLAGQVRPIRTVSGLDITETTLFQLYQSIGGTKSMRQLTRTEKQLLSILSVFKQMGRAGALGDMTKTLGQFANQSRMMTEYWAQLKTWTGVVLKDLIEDLKVLTYINALLITMSEIMRSIAKARGADSENFVDGLYQSTQDTNAEIDELQGKLLDFDKFRSLEDGGQEDISIDDALLSAITGYSSNIDKANNEAQALAESWLEILGFTVDEEGVITNIEAGLEKLKEKIMPIVALVGGLLTMGIATKVVGGISSIISGLKSLSGVLGVVLKHPVILVVATVLGLLTYLYSTNEDIRESINGIFDALKPLLGIAKDLLGQLGTTLDFLYEALVATFDFFALGINVALLQLVPFIGALEFVLKLIETIFDVLWAIYTLDFSNLSKNLKDLWSNWSTEGFAKNAWTSTKSSAVKFFANGGEYYNGDVFVANERGAEIVYSNDGGSGGGVLNIKQYKEATRQGTLEALNSWWGGKNARADIPQLEGVDEVGVYKLATSGASKFGKGWSNK